MSEELKPLLDDLAPAHAAEEVKARELAARYHLEFVDVGSFAPDPDILTSVPVELMFRYNFLPYRREGGRLVLVMADPTDIPVIDELSLLLKTPIAPAVGTPSAIQEALKKGQGTQRVLEQASESFKIQVLRDDDNGDEVLSVDRIQADQSPIIRLIDSTIFDALNRRASDIHIETRDDAVVIKYRIDGVLQAAMKPIAKEHHSTLISRIKVMAELDIAEKRVPQDGRFRVRVRGRAIDFRVSIMPSAHGEDAVIRILDKESLSKQFSSLRLDILGFDEKELARFRRFIREPYGMVLVTGPTGSGKTTTLYAALSEIKTEEDKIITIEDPIEYQLRGITQIPVNEKKGLTFARGLRSILRHDPDKVMVGEIRDAETADIAIQAALTGHLVFTTVHANNVIDVLGRFLNMKIEPYNFVSALNCVQAQRLVRTICVHCKREVRVSRQLLEESGLDPLLHERTPFFEGAGCLECGGTGYKGRMAISELLDLSDQIRELILARRSSAEIKRAAREEGMIFLRESAVGRALAGHTTLHEINKVTFVEVVSGLPPVVARGLDFLRRQLLEAEYPLLAVEVRSRGLGVARLAREEGRVVLVAAASADLPAGLLSLSSTEPNIADPAAFERLLASLLERAGALREGPVALVLPDPVARLTVLPASELAGKRGTDVLEMARFRLRKTVPFEIKDAHVALALPPRGGPDTAVVAAILRPVVADYETVLQRLGLAPGLVELSSLALLSLVEPTGGDRLLVNWDEGYASLVLTRDGWPVLVRTLPDVSATREALPREVANTLLYYRDRLGGAGLAGASVRSVGVAPGEAAELLEGPLGLLPTVLDPWATLGGGELRPGQAVAGAVAAALRSSGRAA